MGALDPSGCGLGDGPQPGLDSGDYEKRACQTTDSDGPDWQTRLDAPLERAPIRDEPSEIDMDGPRNASLQIQPTRAKSTCGTAAMAHFGLPKPNVSTKPSQVCHGPFLEAAAIEECRSRPRRWLRQRPSDPLTPHGRPRKVPCSAWTSRRRRSLSLEGMAAAEGLDEHRVSSGRRSDPPLRERRVRHRHFTDGLNVLRRPDICVFQPPLSLRVRKDDFTPSPRGKA